jgi:hypothetical protein
VNAFQGLQQAADASLGAGTFDYPQAGGGGCRQYFRTVGFQSAMRNE